MSRIGKQPIEIPDGVNVAVDPGRVTVNGPLGELTQNVPARIKIEKEDGQLVVTRPTERGDDRALHGLTRSLVANMVEGVTNGFEKRLEIQGVGYRASLRGTALELNVGFSHPVVIDAPAGITFEVPTQTEIIVKGIDKQAGRRDRRRGARRPAARAVQGQGHPLPGRVRAPEGRKEGVMADADRQTGAHSPPQASAEGRLGHGRAAAARRLPLEPRDRGAAHRRRRREDPRRRELAAPQEDVQGQQAATRRPRSARRSPPPRSRPASRPPSSTAAATCTTGASRRSPTQHVRED